MRTKAGEHKLNIYHIIAAVLFALIVVIGVVLLFIYTDSETSVLDICLMVMDIGGFVLLSLGLFLKKRVLIIIGGIVLCLEYLYWFIGSLVVFIDCIQGDIELGGGTFWFWAPRHISGLVFNCFFAVAGIVMAVSACKKQVKPISGWLLIICGSLLVLDKVLDYLGVFGDRYSFGIGFLHYMLVSIGIVLYGIGCLAHRSIKASESEKKDNSHADGGRDVTDTLVYYADLYKNGNITEEEFAEKKKELLGL